MNIETLKEIDLCNADSLHYGDKKYYIGQLESLCRDQQAEIERLKKIIESLEYFGAK